MPEKSRIELESDEALELIEGLVALDEQTDDNTVGDDAINYELERKVDDWIRWGDEVDVIEEADSDGVDVTIKGLSGVQKREIQRVGLDADDVLLVYVGSDVEVCIGGDPSDFSQTSAGDDDG